MKTRPRKARGRSKYYQGKMKRNELKLHQGERSKGRWCDQKKGKVTYYQRTHKRKEKIRLAANTFYHKGEKEKKSLTRTKAYLFELGKPHSERSGKIPEKQSDGNTEGKQSLDTSLMLEKGKKRDRTCLSWGIRLLGSPDRINLELIKKKSGKQRDGSNLVLVVRMVESCLCRKG